MGTDHGTHLTGGRHAEGGHVYFPHAHGRPPLSPWIGYLSDVLATLPPGKLCHQQLIILGHYSHGRSCCCSSFSFPPIQMFSYVLILLLSLPKFLELCSIQSESPNIFNSVWRMLLPSTSLRYAWLFAKNKVFQPIRIGAGRKS